MSLSGKDWALIEDAVFAAALKESDDVRECLVPVIALATAVALRIAKHNDVCPGTIMFAFVSGLGAATHYAMQREDLQGMAHDDDIPDILN